MTLEYVKNQRAVLMAWKAAVADAVGKGFSREETIAKVRFDDAFGPVDVGQAYMMDHIQNNNAGSLGQADGDRVRQGTLIGRSVHSRGAPEPSTERPRRSP